MTCNPVTIRLDALSARAVLLCCLLTCLSAEPSMGQGTLGRYTYLEYDGVYAFYRPRDVAAYRQLLPKVFDLPDVPLVLVFVADFYRMDPATQPYLEAAVSLLAKHEGKTVWHCIAMPVTSDEARRLGVKFLGFPKAMGEIAFQRREATYTGTLKLDGKQVMRIGLTTEGHAITEEENQWFQRLTGIRSLNLLNGEAIDPMGDRPNARMSLLDLSRTYPDKMEVRVGKADLSLVPETAAAHTQRPADAFCIQPGEIVLAYYLKNKFGFSFPRRATTRE